MGLHRNHEACLLIPSLGGNHCRQMLQNFVLLADAAPPTPREAEAAEEHAAEEAASRAPKGAICCSKQPMSSLSSGESWGLGSAVAAPGSGSMTCSRPRRRESWLGSAVAASVSE